VSGHGGRERVGGTALSSCGWSSRSGLAGAEHWVGRCAGLFDHSLLAGPFGDRGRVGLSGRPAVGGLLAVGGRVCEEVVEATGEVALEAAQRALGGLAFSFFASEVLLGRWVALGAGDRDDVQRVVELAVPAAIEPVLGALPRGARDRGGPRLQPEARVFAELLDAGGVADQDRGGQRAAAELGQQLRAVCLDELEQLRLELIRLAVEAAQLRDLLTSDPDPSTDRQLP
jgi:hypothetical protein